MHADQTTTMVMTGFPVPAGTDRHVEQNQLGWPGQDPVQTMLVATKKINSDQQASVDGLAP